MGFAFVESSVGVEVGALAFAAHAVDGGTEVYVVFAEDVECFGVGGHEILDGAFPVAGGVVVFHVPCVVCNAVEGYF